MCDEGGSLKNGGNRFLSMHDGGGVRGRRRALRCLGRAETGGRSELQAFRKREADIYNGSRDFAKCPPSGQLTLTALSALPDAARCDAFCRRVDLSKVCRSPCNRGREVCKTKIPAAARCDRSAGALIKARLICRRHNGCNRCCDCVGKRKRTLQFNKDCGRTIGAQNQL